jgi:hypothetical protein
LYLTKYVSLEFRGEGEAEDTNFRIINMKMVFKAISGENHLIEGEERKLREIQIINSAMGHSDI